MRSSTCLAALLIPVVLACGDDSTTSDSASGATMVTTAPTAPTTGGDVPTTGGSASQTDGDPATTDDSDSGPKLDVGTDDQPIACGCEFNYVWVANAEESTVSKINMETLVEEARYLTRQDGAGNPSRTSVSLAGDVAVANRHSGLVKFHADPADCEDTNGTPGIQTSTGKNDVLAWDQEECRAWYVPFDTTNQRPVAWTQGDVSAGCSTSGEKVWTVMSEKKALFPGLGAPGGVIVSLVDGETGTIDKQITIPTFSGNSFGAYGGAVNLHGDLFFTSMGFDGGQLAKVYIDNFAYKVWAVPKEIGPYGITVDHNGRVWLSSNALGGNGVGRFDPETEEWALVDGFYSGAGLAEGPNDLMWVSSNNGVNSVDINTLAPGPVLDTGEYYIKGVSFDADGFLWAVNWSDTDEGGNPLQPELVLKYDIAALAEVGSYDGLDRPYTYSDFTGNALFNVTCHPQQ